jgi:hypothetical protein
MIDVKDFMIILFPLFLILTLLVRKNLVWKDKILFVSYFFTVATLASLFIYYGGAGHLITIYDVLKLVVAPSMLILAFGISFSVFKLKMEE